MQMSTFWEFILLERKENVCSGFCNGAHGEKAPGAPCGPSGRTSGLLSSCRGSRGKYAVTVSVLECWDLLLTVK